MSSDSDFDRVQAELPDVEDYITSVSFGDHTADLEKNGTEARGAHPVHGSNTGTNFSVSGNQWYCHREGHKNGGGLFEWVAVDQGIVPCDRADEIKPHEYAQALRKAASEADVDVNGNIDPERMKERQQTRQLITEIYEKAAEFYHLKLTPEWRDWLHDKYGLDADTLEKSLVGFAPTNERELYQHLKSEGYDDDELEQTGLFVKPNGNLIDFFSGRIVFPYIVDGKPRYFIGRKTPETPNEKWEKGKYRKLPRPTSKEYVADVVDEPIFGRDSVYHTDVDRVIVTEGVTDVLRLQQEGYAAVAPVTTQFKEDRVNDIARLLEGKEIVVVMDEDADSEAGLKGATKTAVTLQRRTKNANVSVGRIPAKEDQDVDVVDYLKQNPKAAFERDVLRNRYAPYEAKFRWGGGNPADLYQAGLNEISWPMPVRVFEDPESDDGEKFRHGVHDFMDADTVPDAHQQFERYQTELDGTERQRLYQEIITMYFDAEGLFFKTDRDILYYFFEPEGKVIRVDGHGNRTVSEDFIGLVGEESGVMPSSWSRDLLTGVKALTRRQAPEREMHSFSHYDKEANELYINAFDGGYWAVEPGNVEYRHNGRDVFFRDVDAEPWEYLPEEKRVEVPNQVPGERPIWQGRGDRVHRYITNRINYADDAALAPAQQRKQLYLHLHTMPFGTVINARPIMGWVGVKGSGKTVAMRSIKQLFYGKGATESTMPDAKEDFLAIVNNAPFAFIDNYDNEEKWANDTLAAVATGTSVALRELYTTSELAEYQPDTWISITSRDPPFNRDDVADRTLVFRTERLDPANAEFIGTGDYLRQVTQHRDSVLSEWVDNLRLIMAEYRDRNTAKMSSSHRMADWAIFAQIIADALEVPDVEHLLETMETERARFALEDDRTARLLDNWISDNPKTAAKWWSAGDLLDLLKDAENEHEGALEKSNAAGMGSWLSQYRDELRELMNMKVDDSGRSNRYAFEPDTDSGDSSRSGLDKYE